MQLIRYFSSYILLLPLLLWSRTATLPNMPTPTPIANLPLINKSTNANLYPKDFRSPLDIPLALAGTFGELRTNHFHAGIDIKTNQSENLNIYAIGDGYVSRIKTDAEGYGNALYITHTNGYTSVYAHLNTYVGSIGAYLKQQQYQAQKFELDLNIPAGVLPVSKGQVVAKSGNTGSSNAPHLHFEIRDTYSEQAINPLLFGYEVPDHRRPTLQQVALYAVENTATHSNPVVYTARLQSAGNYTIEPNIVRINSPMVGLGIKAFDQLDATNNWNGVYSVQVYDNGQHIYGYNLERVPFEETRYINSHTDFCFRKSGKGWMQKCFKDPGNLLTIYNQCINQGLINLADGLIHKITFEVRDVTNNLSTLSLNLQYDAGQSPPAYSIKPFQSILSYNTDNNFDNGSLRLQFPRGTFYTDLQFEYSSSASARRDVYSPMHQVHEGCTPVHQYYTIGIVPTSLPPHLYEHALIAYVNEDGRTRSAGGSWQGNYLTGKAREFGVFYITADTIAPRIVAHNFTNGKILQKQKDIAVRISDNLSGIQSYNGFIDNKWVLMEYDQKSSKLSYEFDENVPITNTMHELVVRASDYANNTTTFTGKFKR